MKNEFSIALSPSTAYVSLKALWVVEADSYYDVYKKDTDKKELVLIRTVNGQGMLIADRMDPFFIDEGTLLLVELRKIRRYCCLHDNWDFFWFEFCAAEIPDLFLYKMISAPYLENEEEKIISCMNMLREDDRISQNLASSCFSVLLYSWLKGSGLLYSSSLPYEKEIRETASYMQNHLREKISMAKLAQKVGVCDKYFRELFKAVYHLPPNKYFNQLRMKAAEALLTNTNLTIFEISERLGFYSQFHFTREFKKYCQKTPTEFRRILSNKK